jgi:hypothetical protein
MFGIYIHLLTATQHFFSLVNTEVESGKLITIKMGCVGQGEVPIKGTYKTDHVSSTSDS